MNEWWINLTPINQFFYCGALFFSLFMIWQLISLFIGIGGDDADADADVGDADHTYDDFEHGAEGDAAESVASFRILSLRSIVAFFTLFFWSGALDLAGMFAIAGVFYLMRRMTQTGTKNLASAVGETGTVYLNIPEGGSGEVRVIVSGTVSYIKARGAGGKALKVGTPVKVLKNVGQESLEVTPVDETEGSKGEEV